MTKIMFLGDIYSDEKIKNSWISNDLLKIIKNHDFVSCNFEGGINSKLKPIKKIGPHLASHQTVIESCAKSNINIFNIGNNHIMDYGITGLIELIDGAKKLGIKTVGAGKKIKDVYKSLSIKQNNLTIDFISACESEFGTTESSFEGGGVAWINDPLIDKKIIESKKNGNFTIVQPHAGEETNLPIPEWRKRYHQLIDLGADLIVAHHPHQPQGWEIYNTKHIYYSLGNFYFSHKKLSSSILGYTLSVKISSNFNYKASIIPIINKRGTVKINKLFSKKIESLSKNITSPRYLSLANSQALNLWEKYYSKYMQRSVKKSFLNFNKRKFDYLMIFHNSKIESHKWTIDRAVKLLIKK